jgi:anti-sigma factor RsiW
MDNTRPEQDLLELIPFYVNGTLAPADRARIDAALATSAALRAELEAEQALAVEVRSSGREWLPGEAETEARLATMQAQLEAAEQPKRMAENPHRASLLAMLHPRNWHPAVALALAVAVAAQGAWIVSKSRQESYQVAGGGDGGQTANTARLVVRIKPEASWGEVEALLDRLDLQVVSGPDDGRLILRPARRDADAAQLAVQLSASPLIAFAGELK